MARLGVGAVAWVHSDYRLRGIALLRALVVGGVAVKDQMTAQGAFGGAREGSVAVELLPGVVARVVTGRAG